MGGGVIAQNSRHADQEAVCRYAITCVLPCLWPAGAGCHIMLHQEGTLFHDAASGIAGRHISFQSSSNLPVCRQQHQCKYLSMVPLLLCLLA
jgi:hypothetical protein